MVAKVAAQTAKYYGEAAEALSGDGGAALKGSEQKAWPSVLGWQQKTFEAWAQFHAAAEHEAAHEYGLQVARLAKADEIVAAVGAAQKAGAAPSELQESWADALAVISREHAKAVRHNDTVYTERVPSFATLPSVECKSIVRLPRPSCSRPPPPPPSRPPPPVATPPPPPPPRPRRRTRPTRRPTCSRRPSVGALGCERLQARRDDLLRDPRTPSPPSATEDADLFARPPGRPARRRTAADLPEEYLLPSTRWRRRRRGRAA